MKRRTLGVDLDNVIARTDATVRRLVRELYGIRLERRHIVEFEYHRCGLTREQEHRVFETFNKVARGEVALMPGAREALELLRAIYKVQIVTSRNPSTSETTARWLQRKRVPFDDLCFPQIKAQNSSHSTT